MHQVKHAVRRFSRCLAHWQTADAVAISAAVAGVFTGAASLPNDAINHHRRDDQQFGAYPRPLYTGFQINRQRCELTNNLSDYPDTACCAPYQHR